MALKLQQFYLDFPGSRSPESSELIETEELGKIRSELREGFSQAMITEADYDRLFRLAKDERDVEAFNRIMVEAKRRNSLEDVYAIKMNCDSELLRKSGLIDLINSGSVKIEGGWPDRENELRFISIRNGVALLEILANPSFVELFREVTELDLSSRESLLNDKTFINFLETFNLPSLKNLNLDSTALGQRAILALSKSEKLGGLESLHLNEALIGNQGLMQLCDSPSLHSVKYLTLRDTEIGSSGLRRLGHSELLNGLEYLDISENKFSAVGFVAMCTSPYARGLTHLNVARTNAEFTQDILNNLVKLRYLNIENSFFALNDRNLMRYSEAKAIKIIG